MTIGFPPRVICVLLTLGLARALLVTWLKYNHLMVKYYVCINEQIALIDILNLAQALT